MRALTIVAAVLAALLAAIAVRNWNLVVQPVPVDLFATTVNVSLALLLFIGFVAFAVLYFTTVGRLRMAAALESRDLHRELDRARRMADRAEDSRMADLRAWLEREIPEIEVKLDQALERLNVRVPDAALVRTPVDATTRPIASQTR